MLVLSLKHNWYASWILVYMTSSTVLEHAQLSSNQDLEMGGTNIFTASHHSKNDGVGGDLNENNIYLLIYLNIWCPTV